jgi:hypothetical protein
MSVPFGLLAFACFALATDAQHLRQLGRRPLPRLKRLLRAAGWAALALGFVAAVHIHGWVFGPLHWAGATMLGAGAVFLAANLLPPLPRRGG